MKKFLAGFTILEMVIVVAILGLLIVFALPNFTKSKDNVYKQTCMDNLRRIHTAKELFAIEHNKITGDACVAEDLNRYIKGGAASLFCPDDPSGSFSTSYSINAIGASSPPACRIKSDHRITP